MMLAINSPGGEVDGIESIQKLRRIKIDVHTVPEDVAQSWAAFLEERPEVKAWRESLRHLPKSWSKKKRKTYRAEQLRMGYRPQSWPIVRYWGARKQRKFFYYMNKTYKNELRAAYGVKREAPSTQ